MALPFSRGIINRGVTFITFFKGSPGMACRSVSAPACLIKASGADLSRSSANMNASVNALLES